MDLQRCIDVEGEEAVVGADMTAGDVMKMIHSRQWHCRQRRVGVAAPHVAAFLGGNARRH